MLLLCPFGALLFSQPGQVAEKQRHAVVTGAAGYLGRELCAQLLAENWRVTAVVRQASAERSSALVELARSAGSLGDLELLSLDLMDEDALTEAIKRLRPSVVFHAGGIFRRCQKPMEEMVQPNIAMAEAIIRAAAASPSKPLVIYTSSMAAVRGPGQVPRDGRSCFDEEDWNRQSRPENGWGEAYQYSKVESELRAKALADELKVGFVSLCPSFILGPERGPSDGSGFSVSMVLSWMRGEQKVRSLLISDVRDVAAAHLAAAKTTPGQRFIVSTEVRPLPEEVAQVLREVVASAWGSEAAKAIRATSPPTDGPACMRPGAQEVQCKERLGELQIHCRDALETVRDMASHLASVAPKTAFRFFRFSW